MNKVNKKLYYSFKLDPTIVDYIFKEILKKNKDDYNLTIELGKYDLITKIIYLNQFENNITLLLKYQPYGHFPGCDLFVEVDYETKYEFTEEMLMDKYIRDLFSKLEREVKESIFNID
jgi:hypothetical protein